MASNGQRASRALLYCAGGGIGDSLVASVVARALHQRFSVVDALTLPGHRDTLQRVPDVDGVLVDDGSAPGVIAERLAQRRYDACVVTWATARAAAIAAKASIPVRVGQSHRLYSRRFTVRVPVRSERGDVTTHWSDILLDFARAIGCDAEDRRYRFVPTSRDEREASCLLQGLHVEDGFVMLGPCNAAASRRGMWPVQGWSALAAALHARFNVAVLVCGSAADAPIAQAVAREARERLASARVLSIAGATSIGAFGALAARARTFVGITTGSMHVAAAVGAPTVGIFPFQSDVPERWAPLGERTAVVRATFPCHPGDTKERCRDYACVAGLDVPRILGAAVSLAPQSVPE